MKKPFRHMPLNIDLKGTRGPCRHAVQARPDQDGTGLVSQPAGMHANASNEAIPSRKSERRKEKGKRHFWFPNYNSYIDLVRKLKNMYQINPKL